MTDIKKEIAFLIKEIIKEVSIEEIEDGVEIPNDKKNGDYSFICFKIAKILKKSPIEIAKKIEEELNLENTIFEKVEVINGFVNFFVKKEELVKNLLNKIENKEELKNGIGKTVIIEYSSPNIAKYFHIGHFKNTIIGKILVNLYKELKYKVITINHVGDYGTQFAKLIVAYKKWGKDVDLTIDPIGKLTELYIKINKLCEEEPEVLEVCRQTFKKLEDGDEECVKLWEKFKDISMGEFYKIYELLDVHFDHIIGESFYSDKLDEVYDLLEKSGKLEKSRGAYIVDLKDEGIDTPGIVKKSDDTSIYLTRDLATVLYRTRRFDFDKCLYIIGNEQKLHMKQVFAVSKYLGIEEKYLKGLEHVNYGLIRLPEGKMSTRKGNFIKTEDIINLSMNKVREMLIEKGIDESNIDEIAKKVGVCALIFGNISDSRIKDSVFDINSITSFSGDTGPYVQYMVVRINSILNKSGMNIDKNIDYKILTDEYSIELIKGLSEFNEVIVDSTEKNEPSILARYLINISKLFSSFYTNNKVINEDKEIEKARIYLAYNTKIILEKGLNLLGVEVPIKM